MARCSSFDQEYAVTTGSAVLKIMLIVRLMSIIVLEIMLIVQLTATLMQRVREGAYERVREGLLFRVEDLVGSGRGGI